MKRNVRESSMRKNYIVKAQQDIDLMLVEERETTTTARTKTKLNQRT